MVCPRCLTEGEIMYSDLSRGLMCFALECGWEQNLESSETYELVEDFEGTVIPLPREGASGQQLR